MTEEEKVAWAKEQLISKCALLGRVPVKTDFDESTRSRIKSFLGPWPRALEKAGLKEPQEPKSCTYAASKGRRKKKQNTKIGKT